MLSNIQFLLCAQAAVLKVLWVDCGMALLTLVPGRLLECPAQVRGPASLACRCQVDWCVLDAEAEG